MLIEVTSEIGVLPETRRPLPIDDSEVARVEVGSCSCVLCVDVSWFVVSSVSVARQVIDNLSKSCVLMAGEHFCELNCTPAHDAGTFTFCELNCTPAHDAGTFTCPPQQYFLRRRKFQLRAAFMEGTLVPEMVADSPLSFELSIGKLYAGYWKRITCMYIHCIGNLLYVCVWSGCSGQLRYPTVLYTCSLAVWSFRCDLKEVFVVLLSV